MAAGFSIDKKNISKFRENMLKVAEEELTQENLIPEIKIDQEIKLNDISEDLNQILKEFEPFGIGNPEPVFLTKGLEVVAVRLVGKEYNHLKLTLKDKAGLLLDAVGFGLSEKKPSEGELTDIVYSIRENIWNSRKRLEARIKDLKKTS